MRDREEPQDGYDEAVAELEDSAEDTRPPRNSDAMEDLRGMNDKELLELGRAAMLKELVQRMREGTASHQDMANLLRALKDNGLVLSPSDGSADPPPEEKDTKSATEFPDFDPDTED